MDMLPRELVHTVNRELDCCHQLLVLARIQHCLLRQRRWSAARRLALREAYLLGQLETLGRMRGRLLAETPSEASISQYLWRMQARRASLVRRLRPVARANRAMETRSVLRERALFDHPWVRSDPRSRRFIAS